MRFPFFFGRWARSATTEPAVATPPRPAPAPTTTTKAPPRLVTKPPPSPRPPPPPPDAGGDDDVVDIADVDAVDISGLVARLRILFTSKGYQPPLAPTAALRLLELTRRADVDPAKAAAVFADDPLLAARVLQIARSPLYGAAQVPTLRDAVVRLGSRKLHDVTLEAAMDMRVFRSPQYQQWMDSIRTHSIAVGHAARVVAGQIGGDADQAFFAGLVHDVGAAAVLGAVGGRQADFHDITHAALAACMDELHTEVGAMVADAWRMPAEVRAVIVGHHHLDDADPGRFPIVAVVLAEALAIDAGFGVISGPGGPSMDPLSAEDLSQAKADAGLDSDGWQRLHDMVTPMFAMLRGG
jgi:HD-like signal output (HDOD) protein